MRGAARSRPDVSAVTEPLPPLSAEDSARLLEFARSCKAAARAVVLYPGGHPSIATTVGRIVNLTSPVHQSGPMRIQVLTNNLLLDGQTVARPDPAVTDLAALLHAHLVGEIIVHAGGDLEGWQNFLLLIGRSPDDVRADGGIARAWSTIAGRHIEVREIDYAEVLREKSGGDPATWERVIGNCLHGDAQQIDDASLAGMLEIAGDVDRLGNLLAAVDARATTGGQTLEGKTAAIVRLIQNVVNAVNTRQPDALEPVLRNMASVIGQLSPEMMVSLLSHSGAPGGTPTSATDLIGSVVNRMTDGTIARFVSRNAASEGTATDRLAQAFRTLVRDGEQRDRLLTLAHDDAKASPLGSTAGFEEVWSHVAEKLLHSYSDEPFISKAYARELSGARTDAISVEHTSDDPPERVARWIATVATTELRRLDLALLVDLLRIEEDDVRWADLMTPIVELIQDLLLVGDFDAAENLLNEIRVRIGARDVERAPSGGAGRDSTCSPRADAAPCHRASADDRRRAGRARSRRCACRSARCSCGRSPRPCRPRNGAARVSASRPSSSPSARRAAGRSSASRAPRIPPCAARRSICCANSAAPMRCPT